MWHHLTVFNHRKRTTRTISVWAQTRDEAETKAYPTLTTGESLY
jgi:hypothetical protein